jgi:hypothetical protein
MKAARLACIAGVHAQNGRSPGCRSANALSNPKGIGTLLTRRGGAPVTRLLKKLPAVVLFTRWKAGRANSPLPWVVIPALTLLRAFAAAPPGLIPRPAADQ